MSVNEILAEMDKLSSDELKILQEKLDLFREDFEETPEMLAAIDEGIRSLEEEGSIPLEDVLKELASWQKDLCVSEILSVLHKLSPNDLELIKKQLDPTHLPEFEANPEMLAAIEEGRRSLHEEGGIPIEDVMKEVETWNTKSL
jgi:uncharacterized protein (UPF0262 family)